MFCDRESGPPDRQTDRRTPRRDYRSPCGPPINRAKRYVEMLTSRCLAGDYDDRQAKNKPITVTKAPTAGKDGSRIDYD